jgi:hypothetical protein
MLVPLKHKLIGFYNRDERFLLRGTDWVFKEAVLYTSLKGYPSYVVHVFKDY